MFDRDALNNKWIEARQAYESYIEYGRQVDNEYMFRECGHNDLRRKKNGERDRRYPCKVCENKSDKAREARVGLYHKWGILWDLFDEIGMDMKEER